MKISIAGAGAFGSAIASVFAKGGHSIKLFSPTNFKELCATRVPRKLGNIKLPAEIDIVSSLEKNEKNEYLFLAVPTQNLASFCKKNKSFLTDRPLIACCKGVDQETGLRPSEILSEHSSKVAVMSGPSFAVDISKGMPTALVLASAEPDFLRKLQSDISMHNFRLYRTSDVVGVELGGALKNIIAIACGIAIGAKQGDSARAALMTRGFSEMIDFAEAHGAKEKTLTGLSGLGDLSLTCNSEKSRNFVFGVSLGCQKPFNKNITIEGVATAFAVSQKARSIGLEMPITSSVSALVEGSASIEEVINSLLSRPTKEE
jgi:glycerol-3-phosphate dehydrogenase (NAD(P)+)